MNIGNVVQRGSAVYVYDTKGQQVTVIGLNASDELKGYTSSTINIKRGNATYTYDEKGRLLFSR